MRIALAGKGGAGKTTISATLARLLAREGRAVVAIDADSSPNLAVALGVPRAAAGAGAALPPSLVSRRLDGPALSQPLDGVLDRWSLRAPDGVRMLTMGAPAHAEQGCLCSAHATVSAVLADLGQQPGMDAIVDLEASPEHLSRGTARHADVLLLVGEPYYRALEAVRRLAALAAELPIPRVAVVANKVRSDGDAEAVGEFCARHDLEPIGSVPWSEDVLEADRQGLPLLDLAADGAAVEAIVVLLHRLRTKPVGAESAMWRNEAVPR